MTDLAELYSAFDEGGVVVDREKFDPDKSFSDNGIDSLDVMSLFLAVEEKFGVKFPEDQVERISTASQLLGALNSLQAQSK